MAALAEESRTGSPPLGGSKGGRASDSGMNGGGTPKIDRNTSLDKVRQRVSNAKKGVKKRVEHRKAKKNGKKFSFDITTKLDAEDVEIVALGELKTRCEEKGIELPFNMLYAGDIDATLIRFLRARKLDLDATMIMLEDTLKWRKEDDVDRCLEKPLPARVVAAIRRHQFCSYHGYDKTGKPVYVDRPGLLDITGLDKEGISDEDFLFKHIQEMEYMGQVLLRRASDRKGKVVDSCTMILDLTGLSVTSVTRRVLQVFGKLSGVDQNNYPETNGGTYIVNGGYVFTMVWKLVEPFLDKRTRSKIQNVGSGKKALEKLKSLLFEPTDHEQIEFIEAFLGGKSAVNGHQIVSTKEGLITDVQKEMDDYIAQHAKRAGEPLRMVRVGHEEEEDDHEGHTTDDGGDYTSGGDMATPPRTPESNGQIAAEEPASLDLDSRAAAGGAAGAGGGGGGAGSAAAAAAGGGRGGVPLTNGTPVARTDSNLSMVSDVVSDEVIDALSTVNRLLDVVNARRAAKGLPMAPNTPIPDIGGKGKTAGGAGGRGSWANDADSSDAGGEDSEFPSYREYYSAKSGPVEGAESGPERSSKVRGEGVAGVGRMDSELSISGLVIDEEPGRQPGCKCAIM